MRAWEQEKRPCVAAMCRGVLPSLLWTDEMFTRTKILWLVLWTNMKKTGSLVDNKHPHTRNAWAAFCLGQPFLPSNLPYGRASWGCWNTGISFHHCYQSVKQTVISALCSTLSRTDISSVPCKNRKTFSFCHITATNFKGFYWYFQWQTNTRQHIILKWMVKGLQHLHM